MSSPIVITGASSGIGQALACRLDELGEKLILVARRKEGLEKTGSQLKQDPIVIQADVGDPISRKALIEKLSGFQSIKAMVHNAAQVEPFTFLRELDLGDWQKIMSVNVEAPLFLTQALLGQLKGGRVLHLSSGARSLTISGMVPYCVSKDVLYRIYQGFKQEEPSISFGSVRPGVVGTEMMTEIRQSSVLEEDDHSFYDGLKRDNRLLSPQTVAKFLSWLLCETTDVAFSQNEWDIYETEHHQFWANDELIPSIE